MLYHDFRGQSNTENNNNGLQLQELGLIFFVVCCERKGWLLPVIVLASTTKLIRSYNSSGIL